MENMKAAPQNSQLKQSCKELEKLIGDYTKTKADWQKKLGSFKDSLEEAAPDGKKTVEKLKSLKKACDDDCP